MDDDKQSNSDPLPYTQIDRSAKPKAALLAGMIDVTFQHALGSLSLFWDQCGDPRELERIIDATPPDQEPAVVLPKEEIERRFHVAAGRPAKVDVLTTLGLVELYENGTGRVRGMSRFFGPIKARMARRAAAQIGGKASVEARRKKTGSAQPLAAPSFETPIGDRSGDRTGDRAGGVKRSSNESRTTTERPPKQTRSPADSGQRSPHSGEEDLHAPDKPAPSRKVPDPVLQQLTVSMAAIWLAKRGVPYVTAGTKDTAGLRRLRVVAKDELILQLWERGLVRNDWLRVVGIAQFASQFNAHLDDARKNRGAA